MDKQYLGGRVTVRSLPQYAKVTAPVPDGRIAMEAGELAIVLNGPTLKYLATLEFNTGASRGNHVHHRKDQWLYLMRGRLHGICEDHASHVREEFTMVPGDLAYIRRGIAHVFVAQVDSLALEACAEIYDPSDTEKYVLA